MKTGEDYQSLRKMVELSPLYKTYVIDTTLTEKLLTNVILLITEKTSDELGLVGHSARYDVRNKKKDIISKFKLSKVGKLVKKFGAEEWSFESLEPLANFLYYVEDGIEIFDIDESRDEVIIRWHSNLAAACLVNVSLLSEGLRFEYDPVINTKKKDKKANEVQQKVPMLVSVSVKYGNNTGYDPSEVEEFFERNTLK